MDKKDIRAGASLINPYLLAFNLNLITLETSRDFVS